MDRFKMLRLTDADIDRMNRERAQAAIQAELERARKYKALNHGQDYEQRDNVTGEIYRNPVSAAFAARDLAARNDRIDSEIIEMYNANRTVSDPRSAWNRDV